jgi:hypothetical protein
MATCNECKHLDECAFDCECNYVVFNKECAIHCGGFERPTNADRIRAMTDEELANKMRCLESFALTCGSGWPPEKWLEWLKAEVGE